MFALTPKQAEANKLLGGIQRHSLLVGGARSGKTVLLTRAVCMRACKSPGSRHVIFRFRYNAVHRSIWLDTLPKVQKLCFPRVPFKPHEQDGYVSLPNKSEIWVGGLDDKDRVERILGMEFATVYFNECSQIPFPSAIMALTRLSQKTNELQNRAYYDLNPVGKGHWSYKMFIEQKSPESLERLPDPDNYAHLFMNPKDNIANIDPEFLKSLESLPERTRKRFLEGQYVEQYDGQLWTIDLIEATRVSPEDVPPLKRIIIAVDPSGASGQFDIKSDEIGICVTGRGIDDHGYLLEDASGLYSPEQWGRVVANLYHKHKADKVVAEKNFGGDMVRAVIHGADPNVAYEDVQASRGKAIRAEPIAALYESGKIHHVGRFPQLEDEYTNFTTAGYLGSRSPNHADAAIWGFSKLFPEAPSYGLFALWKEQAEEVKLHPQTRGNNIKVNVSASDLADAQKKEADWMRSVGNLNKLAKTTQPEQINSCPQCGNPILTLFSESYRCGACGKSGSLESLKTVSVS